MLARLAWLTVASRLINLAKSYLLIMHEKWLCKTFVKMSSSGSLVLVLTLVPPVKALIGSVVYPAGETVISESITNPICNPQQNLRC